MDRLRIKKRWSTIRYCLLLSMSLCMFLISGCSRAKLFVENTTDKPIGAIARCEDHSGDNENTITKIIPPKTREYIFRNSSPCGYVKLITAKATIGIFDTNYFVGYVISIDKGGRYEVSPVKRKETLLMVVSLLCMFVLIFGLVMFVFLIVMAIEAILEKKIVFMYVITKHYRITISAMTVYIVLIFLLCSLTSYVFNKNAAKMSDNRIHKEEMLDGINRTLINEIKQVYHD